MKYYIKTIGTILFALGLGITACKKAEYSLGSITAPTNLVLTDTIQGQNTANLGGDGSGNISINVSGNNALSYKVDFGDSTTNAVKTFLGGSLSYKYSKPGEYDYTLNVTAIGTGGAVSILSKKIHIVVVFQLDSVIAVSLTGNISKVWITDRNATGHVGVGPVTTFTPDYYAATPNTRSDCLYDDEITFRKDGSNIYLTLDNKGQSFMINAATAFYGMGTNSGDNCYTIDPGGKKLLIFSAATSGSTADISTRIQFNVSGNGLVNLGTGANGYEILTLTDSTMQLRNIGADGLAWYQKLKVKN